MAEKKLSPVDAVAAWCRAWRDRDLEALHKYTTATYRARKSCAWVLNSELHGFVVNEKTTAPKGSKVMREVTVTLVFEGVDKSLKTQVRKFMVVCEKGPHRPSVDGEWGVNPTSMLRSAPNRATRRSRK